MKIFDPNEIRFSKYIFCTGKGGVGKTSIACAIAVAMADNGQKVLLVSTDPASNLQDVFSIPLNNKGVIIKDEPNLTVANIDPMQSATEYRRGVIDPFRGRFPDSVINNMEEQLSGSCTVEIAAFNEFAHFLTDNVTSQQYDHIIFDTAPTGHTLRLLQLPSAWNDFIEKNAHGASCLGQLSGLADKKAIYFEAVQTLADDRLTTLLLISRPEETPLKEASRALEELKTLGVNNQMMIINNVLMNYDDTVSESLYRKQQHALLEMPENLKVKTTYYVPMRSYNITGIENMRALLKEDKFIESSVKINNSQLPHLYDVVEDLYKSNKKVIFTMGKGGVGKTTIAAAIALALARKGKKVHLTTTDPAAHLDYIIHETDHITMSHIDEAKELKKYQEEVLAKARGSGASESDIAYIEEDLRSPCTQEIAVFRAFADVVEKAGDQVIVIDTAPTGHTLLLLDSTQSYSREITHSAGEVPDSVRHLLPRLRNGSETAVIIVTLPEATPYCESIRLEVDLNRADIKTKWWIINSSMYRSGSKNQLIKVKASNEIEWINKIDKHTRGHAALIPWSPDELKGRKLLSLIN